MKIRKISMVATILTILMITTSVVAFADNNSGSFKIKDSYPVDGQTNTTIENMSVKLSFNKPIGDKKHAKTNAKCFKIVDEKGRKLPIGVYYNPKDDKEVLVLVDMVKVNKLQEKQDEKIIKDKSEYTLIVSSDLQANDGEKLNKKEKITFTTLNQTWNTRVYMIMMFVMMIGMFGFTAFQAKRKDAKEEELEGKDEPFNPYKEAKKTGKPVEEIIAKHDREQAKKKAKAAKKAAKKSDEEDEYVELEDGHYSVGKPRTVASARSKYITGRKAAAEARKAEEERLAKRRAKNKKGKK